MKSYALRSIVNLGLCALSLSATPPFLTASAEPGHIVVDVQSPPQPIPLLYSVSVEQKTTLALHQITNTATVRVHVLQGRPEMVTLGLSGNGTVSTVVGTALHDWSVREETGSDGTARFIELHLTDSNLLGQGQDFQWTVMSHTEITALPNRFDVLLINPGRAASFTSKLMLEADSNVSFQIANARGLTAVGNPDEAQRQTFLSNGESRLKLTLASAGASESRAELSASALTGAVTAAGHSAQFVFSAQFHAPRKGVRLPILWGDAALSGAAAGEGWHVELVSMEKGDTRYELVADQAGQMSFALNFAAPVIERGEWRTFDFAVPTGTAVPITLSGFGENVTFKSDAPIAPTREGDHWKSFLPSDGTLAIAWKQHREAADGSLFFTAEERTDVRVGAGLVRALSQIDLKILQGKLPSLRIVLDGPGEILNVEGTNVTRWNVTDEKGVRNLRVEFSQPIEGQLPLRITSQSELAHLPAVVHPLKFIVEGALRDAGTVRLRPATAMRIDFGSAQGLLQLAANQFPGARTNEKEVGGLVFRFPSTHYDYTVTANRIQPEVAVSQITLYYFTDTDRIVESDLELDIREAALRDYQFLVPAGYTVASVTGDAVADFSTVASDKPDMRGLRIHFTDAVDGRQMVHVRLEKNEPAKAGEWSLPLIRFPEAKSVRGHIGVVAAAGFRTSVTNTTELSEIPLNSFPQQIARLQQAWRLRSENWSAVVQVEALGQSVQADVFHLYTVKSGVVSASVLINYFVVGAPATEWRIEAPTTLGNLEVLGDQVRRDWHRDGKDIVVALHQPVLGAATLLLAFDEPLNDRGTLITPGEIRPLNVQSERGYIELVSSRQVRADTHPSSGAGLLALEPRELPAEFRLLSSAPAFATYQYTDRPFSLAIDLRPYAAAETVAQAIDSAELTSTISRSGEILTEANYLVKTRDAAPLRMTLPAGLKLWEIEVNHHLIDASMDHQDLIIPLPVSNGSQIGIPVKLRFGQQAQSHEKDGTIQLKAPKVLAPIVTATWALHSDEGHLLRPIEATLKPTQSFEKQDGFTLLSVHFLAFAAALGFLLFGSWSRRRKQRWSAILAFILGALALLQTWQLLSVIADIPAVVNGAKDLEYVSTFPSAGADMSISVSNTVTEASGNVVWGIVLAAISAVFLIGNWIFSRRQYWALRFGQAAAAAGLSEGLLVQPDGASYVLIALLVGAGFLLVGAGVSLIKRFIPELQPHLNRFRKRATESGAAGLLIVLTVFAALNTTPTARADQSAVTISQIKHTPKVAERCDQSWVIRDHRVFGTADLSLRAMVGDSFVLLRPPAILSGFTGDDLRLNKQEVDGQTLYVVEATRSGLLRAHIAFEMPVANYGDRIPIPTVSATSQRLTVQFNEGGWDVTSEDAVQIEPAAKLDAQHSGATLILSPLSQNFVALHPRQRDPAKESVEFYDEAQQLFIAGSGAVNSVGQFSVRPVQGQVSELIFEVPAGVIVGDVKGAAIGLWRFDPLARRLQVAVEPAQTKPFNLRVESQLTTGALPYDVTIAPLRLKNARGDSGTIALASEGDVTADAIHATKFNALGSGDFDVRRFLGRNDAATVQNAWHYSADAGDISLRVNAMQPEVRVESKQLFSLDDDRVVGSVELSAEITRVGIFQLSFVLPANLDVEAISGEALAQWSQKNDGSDRIVTMQLRERTLGTANFALTLSGPAPRNAAGWKFPTITLREANRQTGTLIVVPAKGLRLRAVAREHATPIDPQSLGAIQPGTLAFKQLDADSVVTLGLEALTPWITIQALQDISVRDGQTASHVTARIHVENAGIKQLSLRIPGLSALAQRTVRASGSAVGELIHSGDGSENWELRFVRSVIGDADIQIDFQTAVSSTHANDHRDVSPVVFTEARQSEMIVAIHAIGRLSIDTDHIGQGWKSADWSEVPDFLRSNQSESAPLRCFRVEDSTIPLTLLVSRHPIAEGLKLEVTSAELTTLLSSQHGVLTAAALHVRVNDKTRAQFSLPIPNRLFAVLVNGEPVELTKEMERYFFYVTPLNESTHTAVIGIIYTNDSGARKPNLEAPQFDLPMENVQWHVVVPFGFDLEKAAANTGWIQNSSHEISEAGQVGIQLFDASTAAAAPNGVALLDAASASLAGGNQQKALEFLEKAALTPELDDASNEDARVQLKKLKTQRAELSLTTRRERLSLSQNSENANPLDPILAATTQNPLLRGVTNFDLQQFDQLLAGNSAEENEQLGDIAAHLVDHQQDRAPSPRQIVPALKTVGSVTTFSRSLQVDTAKPLQLAIELDPAASSSRPFAGSWLLAAIAGMALLLGGRTQRTE
jgi:hypothetical protein